MKEKEKNQRNGIVISKREFRMLAATKLEARALKSATRSVARRSYSSIKEQNS